MARAADTDPYSTPERDPATRPSVRIARWILLLAMISVFAFGIVSWRADVRDYENLLMSDTAVIEVGRLTDVEVTSTGKTRTTKTHAVAAGTVYEQKGLSEWADHEGEKVRITTHPDTDLWLMTTMDGTLSTERRTRDSALIYSYLSAIPLSFVLVSYVADRVSAPRRDRENARTEALAREHPGVRSRSEMRRLGILPGAPADPGLPSRGD